MSCGSHMPLNYAVISDPSMIKSFGRTETVEMKRLVDRVRHVVRGREA